MKNYFTPIIFLLFVLSIACNQSPKKETIPTPEKIVYEVVFRESLAGTYEKWATGKNSYAYTYAYTDRGRGPNFTEEIRLNEQNFIIDQTIEGVNYRKTPVTENFLSEGSTATWTNLNGKKEGVFNGNQLYFRYDGSPAIYEILAQNLLTADDGQLALYPEGTVGLSQQFPLELSNGRVAQLLMIKGLGMNPSYIWMMDGQMIARIAGNLHVIRADMSAMRLELKALQSQIEDEHLIEMAEKLTHDVQKVVIQNVNIFKKDGTVLPNQDVFINDRRINNISPTGKITIPKKALLIDGQGKTLLPGLFDMHTHNTKGRGLLHLAGGVTSVRDLANNKQLKALSAQFNNNEILGPRIVTFCGIIDGSGPYANQRNVVDNLEEGLAEIADYKALGYQQIKLYSSIRPEWVLPLTEKAHQLNMRVSGHIPAYMTATQAINQGYNEIQHINMLFLNFLSDTIDTRTPLRHTMPAMHGLNLDLQSVEYQDFVELLKAKDILVDPTVAIFENMYLSQKGKPSPTYSKIMSRLPLMNQRSFYTGGLPKSGDTIAIYKASFEKMLAVIYDLYQQGVAIVPGTDGLPGFLYHRELELYVQAGIPPTEVLKLATIISAEITGVANEFGSVETGKQADLILVDGNPIDNISDIRRVEWTMKNGHIYYAKELYDAVGIQHFE